MSKLKLVITLGVSASGKTTYAESLNQVGWMNVNRDDIRKSIYESEHNENFHWDKWDWSREDEVTAEQEKLVLLAKEQNMNVIISDTNLSTKAQGKWKGMADSLDFQFECKVFHVTLKEALRRDSLRSSQVGASIIRRQYSTYQNNCKGFILEHFKNLLTEYWNKSTGACPVISDIDGTVADMTNVRGAFDWHLVSKDKPRKNVIEVIEYFASKCPVLFLSGRDSVCYEDTFVWLDTHISLPTTPTLFMRPEEDYRKDWLIKLEMLEQLCEQGYGKPKLVLDDRNQVVHTFRCVGLEVFQVQDGDF